MSAAPSPLSDEQIRRYWDDGFVGGIPVLTADQMSVARGKLIQLEALSIRDHPTQWVDPEFAPWSDVGSPWWHWFQGMARHPTIVQAACAILGPNVLIRNADIFVKPAGSSRRIQWHTDTTACDHDADKMLTAWLAITHSNETNGCVEWLTGSHRQPLPPEIKDKHSLSFGEASAERANAAARASNILLPGQVSMHHFRTIHRSLGNRSDSPRIGLVIRFMASDTPLSVAESGKGVLVAGRNIPGHFNQTKHFPVSWVNRSTTPQLTVPALD